MNLTSLAFDKIEWIGSTADSTPAITRIIDLNETTLGEHGAPDVVRYGTDEKGIFFNNDMKSYVTGADALEDKETSTGIEIVGDIIIGTDADETIIGGHGDDIIVGNGGDDTLIGSAGSDVLLGGDGDDILLDEDQYAKSRAEAELLAAADGTPEEAELELELALLSDPSDDVLVGGDGFDKIDGDGGRDFVSAGDVTAEIIEEVQLVNAEEGVVEDVFERIFVYPDEEAVAA